MDKARLQAYAHLLVETGINPDPGQDVVITADVENAEFTRMVVEECYRRRVGRVVINWCDMPIEKLHQKYQSEARLGSFDEWEVAKLKWQAEKLPCRLWLDSDDPDGMADVDQGKRTRAQQSRYPVIKPFRDAMENRHQWCIAGVPGRKWAEKVFPGVAPDDAVEKLWEAILDVSRTAGDPIANWQQHNATIHRRAEKLNDYRFSELRYRSGNGTDFRVGLIEQGIFCGAAEVDLSGRTFNPNIPSEEVFTSPRRGDADGVLVATKPLSWQGTLIENFSLRFVGGKAVECHAEKGEDVLKKMIAMDEGAAFIGECALIATSSPVNRSGILFYNTLYDENACCHIALGRGFDNCIRDYGKYSMDELKRMGINDSMIHVDFMIGCDDLDIDGVTADGKTIPVFRNGEWCF